VKYLETDYFELISEYNSLNVKKMHLEDEIDYLKENGFVDELSMKWDEMKEINDKIDIIKMQL
jgi:hypothetical protein